MDENRPPRAVRVNSWSWEAGWRDPRPRVPWLGIFLLLFGGLLLLQEAAPGAKVAGSAFVLALGIAFLLSWAVGRGGFSLFAGAILTGYGLPRLLIDMGAISGSGWDTLGFGLALVFISLVRAGGGRGHLGWLFLIGAFLAALGALEIAAARVPGMPDIGTLFWPIVLLVTGAWLVLRSAGARRGPIR